MGQMHRCLTTVIGEVRAEEVKHLLQLGLPKQNTTDWVA